MRTARRIAPSSSSTRVHHTVQHRKQKPREVPLLEVFRSRLDVIAKKIVVEFGAIDPEMEYVDTLDPKMLKILFRDFEQQMQLYRTLKHKQHS